MQHSRLRLQGNLPELHSTLSACSAHLGRLTLAHPMLAAWPKSECRMPRQSGISDPCTAGPAAHLAQVLVLRQDLPGPQHTAEAWPCAQMAWRAGQGD